MSDVPFSFFSYFFFFFSLLAYDPLLGASDVVFLGRGRCYLLAALLGWFGDRKVAVVVYGDDMKMFYTSDR